MKMKKSLLLVGIAVGLCMSTTYAQRNCGTMHHHEQLLQKDPGAQQRMDAIENFTQQTIQQGSFQKAVVNIPVVVHVVYNTTAQNISQAQIQSQIDVLNKDFRKLNTDASLIPSSFSSVAADCEFNFCLATVDPTGAATSGVTRTQTSVTSFTDDDKVKYTAQGGKDAWPSSSYLNLWVCNLGGGLLGYAQFPGSGAAATDGVVIGYTCFGTTGTAQSPFNKGRTATHEIGHWLNLRHIGGDQSGGCGNDLVSDTPTQKGGLSSNGTGNDYGQNYGAPTHPLVRSGECSGTTAEMFMNYMDYTDDGSMYMFTNGQKSRMQALFASGGARYALLASNGCGTSTGGGTTTPSYCAVTSTNVKYEWIAKVQFGTINNTTTATTGYSDYTAISTSLTKGQAYTISLTPGFASSTYTEYFKVFIDWNNDKDFLDAGEVAFTSAGSTALVSGSITVPTTAVTGNVRMRVIMKDGTITDACTGITYGEVEDYTLSLVASAGGTTGGGTTSGCTDVYESNNTRSAAKTIGVNTAITAMIGTATDVDYFKFTTTTSAPKIKVNLSSLPGDYDLYLYNASGTQIASSANSGTTAEQIIYNTATAGATYYIRVKGYNSAYSATQCYNLLVSTSGVNYKTSNTETIETKAPEITFIAAPNPTNGKVSIELTGAVYGEYMLQIYDQTGRIVVSESGDKADNNPFVISTDLSAYQSGMYFIRLYNQNEFYTEKILLTK